ncbi:MAG: hypothetical protein GYA24_11765 [Candidatus Lokiarchaeota archaeon]|nr:hypothetical protein [Candidatus Lokiarchaeota archaeon]
MGSKFHELLQPTGIRDRDLAGMAVAVDGTAWLHQFLKVTLANPADPGNRLVLVDKTCRLINHLRGFLYRTLHLVQHGIWPIYVFDGACDAKQRNALTREQLRERHLAARKLHAAAIKDGAIPLAKAIAQRMDFAYPIAEQESKALLQLLGMPVVDAPGEGEAQCAWLARRGMVDAVVTRDADALLYGAPVVVNNLAVKQKVAEQLVLRDELARLGITRAQLVDLAILAGTDYHAGVPGIGARTALKLLQARGRIEDVIAAHPGKDWSALGVASPRQPFSAFIDEARARFLQPVVNEAVTNVEWRTPDAGAVRRFLLEHHSFSPDLVEKALAGLAKAAASASASC